MDLHHFAGFFPKLKNLAAARVDSVGWGRFAEIVELLANSNRDEILRPIELDSVDVCDQDEFKESQLFKSYYERAWQLQMTAFTRHLALRDSAKCAAAAAAAGAPAATGAAEAAGGAAADIEAHQQQIHRHLGTARHICSNLSEGHRQTVDMAVLFFDSNHSDRELLRRFLLEPEANQKFLVDHAPGNHLTLACQCMRSGPPSDFTFMHFYIAMDIISRADWKSQHPPNDASVTFMDEMWEAFESANVLMCAARDETFNFMAEDFPKTYYRFMAKTVSVRLNLTMDVNLAHFSPITWLSDRSEDDFEIDAKAVYKAYSKYIKDMPKKNVPNWMVEVREQLKTSVVAAAVAATGAAAAAAGAGACPVAQAATGAAAAAAGARAATGAATAAAGAAEDTNTEAATGAAAPAVASPPSQCGPLWTEEEFLQWNEDAGRLYDQADRDCMDAENRLQWKNLISRLPEPLAEQHGLSDKFAQFDDIDDVAAIALCNSVKENIFACVREAQLAWANCEAQRAGIVPSGFEDSGAGEPPPAIAEPLPPAIAAPLLAAIAVLFKTGDVVIGYSSKKQDLHSNIRCRIKRVLTKQYKCEILEGPAQGKMRNYDFKDVSAQPVTAPDSSPPSCQPPSHQPPSHQPQAIDPSATGDSALPIGTGGAVGTDDDNWDDVLDDELT